MTDKFTILFKSKSLTLQCHLSKIALAVLKKNCLYWLSFSLYLILPPPPLFCSLSILYFILRSIHLFLYSNIHLSLPQMIRRIFWRQQTRQHRVMEGSGRGFADESFRYLLLPPSTSFRQIITSLYTACPGTPDMKIGQLQVLVLFCNCPSC